MNACRPHRERLVDLLDGTLPPARLASLQAHLDQCPACRRTLEDLRRTVERIRALEPVEPPPWLAEKIMAEVRAQAAPGRRLRLRPSLPAAALLLLCLSGYLVTRFAGAPRPLAPPAPPPAAPAGPAAAQDDARPPSPARPAATGSDKRPSAPETKVQDAAPGQATESRQADESRPSAAPPEPAPEPGPGGARAAVADSAGFPSRAAAAPAAKASAPAAGQQLAYRLAPRDPRGADLQVAEAFRRAGATILAPPVPGRSGLSARVPSRALDGLLRDLEALGALDGPRPDPAGLGAEVELAVVW